MRQIGQDKFEVDHVHIPHRIDFGRNMRNVGILKASNGVDDGVANRVLLSLAGVPLTAGFWGKFLVFAAAVKEHQFVLIGVGIVTVAAGFPATADAR